MKFGVNTFIWSGTFDQSNFGLLPIIKEAGFDGVEIPAVSVKGFSSVQHPQGSRGQWPGM